MLSRPHKATVVRSFATIVLCVGANLALMQAVNAMSTGPTNAEGTVGQRLAIFAPALLSITITCGFFGTMLGLASLIERPTSASAAASGSADLTPMLTELREVAAAVQKAATHRAELPAPPVPKPIEIPVMDRVVHLLEELREIQLMDDAQRKLRLQQYSQRRKTAVLALIDQHIRREEWSQADELIAKLEAEKPGDADAARIRQILEQHRDEAEAEALDRVRSSVEDLMAVSSWDQAYSAAESFTQNFPHNADGQALLARVKRERDVFRDSAVQRLYEQIKRDIEHRQWRKALAGAQRLLERFPDHPKTTKTRQLLRTVQDNAEIEERQEQESRIQQLIKSKRFEEAVSLGEELIRRFPVSPQADAMEDLLPRLREMAIQQEAQKL